MNSNRFDPATLPSSENSACYPYANPSKLKKNLVSNDNGQSFAISTTLLSKNFSVFLIEYYWERRVVEIANDYHLSLQTKKFFFNLEGFTPPQREREGDRKGDRQNNSTCDESRNWFRQRLEQTDQLILPLPRVGDMMQLPRPKENKSAMYKISYFHGEIQSSLSIYWVSHNYLDCSRCQTPDRHASFPNQNNSKFNKSSQKNCCQ